MKNIDKLLISIEFSFVVIFDQNRDLNNFRDMDVSFMTKSLRLSTGRDFLWRWLRDTTEITVNDAAYFRKFFLTCKEGRV